MRAKPSLIVLCAAALVAAAAPFFAPAHAASDTLVKASGPAVYYVGSDNKRYVFPNQAIFNSWYRDFSSVQTIADSELASYPIGGTIFYRPGTRLVKITSDPKVYAVSPGGALHAIASEEAAIHLYGNHWSKRVDDLSDAFFASYAVGDELDGSTHPVGTFFRYTDNTSFYYLDEINNIPTARQIGEGLMSQFRFDKTNALAFSSTEFPYQLGDMIHADEGALFVTAQPSVATPGNPTNPGNPTTPNNPGTPTSTATVTASIYSNLVATQNVVKGDGSARIFAFTLDGDANKSVTISRLTMTLYIDAGGVDTDFSAGFDADDPTFWSINQILSTFALRDVATGQVLDSQASLNADGTVQFKTTIVLAAKAKRSFELTASVQTIPSNIRISADITPSTDIVATSAATTTTAKPATSLNGGITPGNIVTPVEFGTLTMESSSDLGDSLHPLTETLVPYSLKFTADGEPFIISSLSIGFVAGGADFYAIDHMILNYKNQEGVNKTEDESFVDAEKNIYRFINLDLFVPKGQSVTLPITVVAKNDPKLYSGARLQMQFLSEAFSAEPQFSDNEYTIDAFANAAKIKNRTSFGPLILYRQGFVTMSSNPETPTGTLTRYNKLPVMSFNISASSHEIKVHQLTFKVETSDIDEDGDDNDFFERVANGFANQAVGIASHDLDISERTRLTPQSVTFQLFDASNNVLDDTPDGIATGPGDYGIFILNFGSNPITVAAGKTQAYDFDIDTTLISPEHEETLKARLLGDTKGSAPSQANFLWNDGSNILTSGYLVSGLDLTGSNLSVH